MENLVKCYKIKFKFNDCSKKLISDEFKSPSEYQNEMNKCFIYFKHYENCMKQNKN